MTDVVRKNLAKPVQLMSVSEFLNFGMALLLFYLILLLDYDQ